MFRRVAVAYDHAFLWIIGNGAADFHGDVGHDAARGRDVAFFDVGNGAAALLDRGQKIAHVPARGRGGVQFDVFLGDILRILFAFKDAFKMDRFGLFIERDEVCPHGAGLSVPLSP